MADMDWISNCATPLWMVVLPLSADWIVIWPAGIRLIMLLSSLAFSTILSLIHIYVHFTGDGLDLGAALVAEALLHVQQLVLHDLQNAGVVGEDVLPILDFCL